MYFDTQMARKMPKTSENSTFAGKNSRWSLEIEISEYMAPSILNQFSFFAILMTNLPNYAPRSQTALLTNNSGN